MMGSGLRGVRDLYELAEELFHLPSSQLCLQTCQKKWIEEQLDCFLRLLDLIGSVRDILVSMREHVQDLESAIRRKGNTVYDSRKKTQKMIKDCLESLKQMSSKSVTCSIDKYSDQLVMVLMKGKEITTCLLRSILFFLSKPKTKPGRWHIVTKAISKRKASYDCIQFTHVDSFSVQNAHGQLETLEVRMESLESGLGFLFRQLIQNRVSLLNILTL